MTFLIFSFFFFLIPLKAIAYIGPGMGGGLLIGIIGILLSIFIALGVVIYYPIKKLFNNKKKKKKN